MSSENSTQNISESEMERLYDVSERKAIKLLLSNAEHRENHPYEAEKYEQLYGDAELKAIKHLLNNALHREKMQKEERLQNSQRLLEEKEAVRLRIAEIKRQLEELESE